MNFDALDIFVFGIFNRRVVIPTRGRIHDDPMAATSHFNGGITELLADGSRIGNECLRKNEESFHGAVWLLVAADSFSHFARVHSTAGEYARNELDVKSQPREIPGLRDQDC